MLLLLLCRATRFKDFGRGGGGDLESDPQRTRHRSSVAATAAAAADDDDFRLVVFKIGSAEFDLAAWVCVRVFDLAGDAVE
jgi:hypothetical protein